MPLPINKEIMSFEEQSSLSQIADFWVFSGFIMQTLPNLNANLKCTWLKLNIAFI